MSNKHRSPYQPSLPQKKVVSPPVSLGYPPPRVKVQKKFEENIEEIKARETLREAGLESATAKEFLKLLEDEKRLAEVVKKLKLKAFW